MKTAWLLHGTGGSDKDYFWFADTKKYLESKEYKVWWPQLPNTFKPNLKDTKDFIEYNDVNFIWDKETIIIGHSSACPVILELLQYFKVPVKQVILVAGFYKPINDGGFSELMLPNKEFDYESIKKAAKEIVLINSDNDPWGCNDKQSRPIAIKLGAIQIVATGQGHMGSGTYKQQYPSFGLLKRIIL